MATHLVIGDPHCNPKASNDRFLWAGKLAKDLKPDTIVCMGDFSSLDSLSSYDKGKKSFEGRRYKKDIDHAHDALEKFMKHLNLTEQLVQKTLNLKSLVGKLLPIRNPWLLMVSITATIILLVLWVSLLVGTTLLVLSY